MPAIRSHSTPTSDTAWDGPAAISNLLQGESPSYYRSAFAWEDPDSDPILKVSYKFPHHNVTSGGEVGAANIKACQSGIGSLNGARNRPKIPAADFSGVHAHLARHLKDAELEVAPLDKQEDVVTDTDSPDEKAASKWEETSTSFRHRLRNPSEFDPDTFRTIRIQRTRPRVMGVVAKPKTGGDSMTLQTLVFPKDQGWTMESARTWASSHNFKSQDLGSDFIGGTKETKDFDFELKGVTDTGSFTGILSVYNVVDLGGDSVEPGAFTKSLAETGGVVPCQWQHREPIGILQVKETPTGLEVQGQLTLDTLPNGTPMVPEAYKAYALMRNGIVKGLSIGYKAIKAPFEKGIRKLQEVRLLEGSVVTFPMLPLAQVLSVKADGQKDTFEKELFRLQIMASRYQMVEALGRSLDSILYEKDIPVSEKTSQSQSAVSAFAAAYVSMLPDYMSCCGMTDSDEGTSIPKSFSAFESKAGRTISAATAERIREAIQTLQSLLGDTTTPTDDEPDEADDVEGAGAAGTEEVKSTPVEPEAVTDTAQETAPVVSSPVPPLDSVTKDIRSLFSWQN